MNQRKSRRKINDFPKFFFFFFHFLFILFLMKKASSPSLFPPDLFILIRISSSLYF